MAPLSVLPLPEEENTGYNTSCTELLLTYLADLSRHSTGVLMSKTTTDISTHSYDFLLITAQSEPFPETVQVTAASSKRGLITFPTTQNLYHIDP